jgi:lipoprotein-anchoring transpeptidase ErfK/SrfK
MGSARLIERSHVRIVEKTEKPARIPNGDKWVHIDLDRQTQVAYEGERSVYATLVTTGKETHRTPTGLYRTQRKYISVTMRGKDPVEGIYHVEEVPWTMFYHGGYAVHGAYWHNDFGKTRSHGCTNLSAADTRWLYHWGSLEVPPNWHAVTGRQGT